MDLKQQEEEDIRTVRYLEMELVHVDDERALDAFQAGEVIFDVMPHAEKLEAFAQKHGLLDSARGAGGNFVTMDGLPSNRPIYVTSKTR